MVALDGVLNSEGTAHVASSSRLSPRVERRRGGDGGSGDEQSGVTPVESFLDDLRLFVEDGLGGSLVVRVGPKTGLRRCGLSCCIGGTRGDEDKNETARMLTMNNPSPRARPSTSMLPSCCESTCGATQMNERGLQPLVSRAAASCALLCSPLLKVKCELKVLESKG